MRWPAIEAARRQVLPRVPLAVSGHEVGSVALADLDALAALAREHPGVQVKRAGVMVDTPRPDQVFSVLNAALRETGLILGWREEPYPIVEPASGQRLGRMERAATRFWGLLTFGAHANGLICDDHGRPQAMWIAQRSLTKATDPGKFDNLVGGGVPDGQSARETLVREGWEEAGLAPARMAHALPGRSVRLRADIPEGLQHEWLQAYDLALPRGVVPANQDGEVAGFRCLPIDEALALAASGEMTTDAALVVLECALRRRLLPDPEHQRLADASAALWGPPLAGSS